jgi:protein-S-isoprenylcysteine O-methyltransferase Ste14
MAFVERAKRAAFRYRGLTPIPFLILAVLYADPILWGLVAGFCLLCVGQLLRFWAISFTGGETRTTVSPYGSRLVTDGPFAYLRNPIYAGNMLIYAGVGLMSMAWFPWLLLFGLGCFALQYGLIISYEEGFLRDRFGEDYMRYAVRVGRFIPRFVKHESERTAKRAAIALGSEKRTLQAEALVVALLLGMYIVRTGQG